jgi:hypothetical protein
MIDLTAMLIDEPVLAEVRISPEVELIPTIKQTMFDLLAEEKVPSLCMLIDDTTLNSLLTTDSEVKSAVQQTDNGPVLFCTPLVAVSASRIEPNVIQFRKRVEHQGHEHGTLVNTKARS